MALFLCEYICWCPWFLPPCIRCWRKCLTKTNFLFMHCKKKKKEKKAPVLGMLYFSIFRLCAQTDHKAFIPTGNQLQLFLCQFSPTPQFRWTCSPTEPTMKDLSSFSLSTSDIFFFFFDCSLYADGMQRMQIRALLCARPLPWMNAALNEATLTPVYTGAREHAQITIGGFACPLSHALSQTSNAQQLKEEDTEARGSLVLQFIIQRFGKVEGCDKAKIKNLWNPFFKIKFCVHLKLCQSYLIFWITHTNVKYYNLGTTFS